MSDLSSLFLLCSEFLLSYFVRGKVSTHSSVLAGSFFARRQKTWQNYSYRNDLWKYFTSWRVFFGFHLVNCVLKTSIGINYAEWWNYVLFTKQDAKSIFLYILSEAKATTSSAWHTKIKGINQKKWKSKRAA